MLFPNVARQQLCPELISKPWKIILLNINTEENVISTEIKGGKFVQVCVSRMVKNREKRLQQESWKSQHGEAMSFPAHNTSVRFVWLWSIPPGSSSHSQGCLLPRSRSETYFCPYTSVATSCSLHQWAEGKVWLAGSVLSRVPWPQQWPLRQQGLPLGVPTSLCLLEKDFKGIRDLVCG